MVCFSLRCFSTHHSVIRRLLDCMTLALFYTQYCLMDFRVQCLIICHRSVVTDNIATTLLACLMVVDEGVTCVCCSVSTMPRTSISYRRDHFTWWCGMLSTGSKVLKACSNGWSTSRWLALCFSGDLWTQHD